MFSNKQEETVIVVKIVLYSFKYINWRKVLLIKMLDIPDNEKSLKFQMIRNYETQIEGNI